MNSVSQVGASQNKIQVQNCKMQKSPVAFGENKQANDEFIKENDKKLLIGAGVVVAAIATVVVLLKTGKLKDLGEWFRGIGASKAKVASDIDIEKVGCLDENKLIGMADALKANKDAGEKLYLIDMSKNDSLFKKNDPKLPKPEGKHYALAKMSKEAKTSEYKIFDCTELDSKLKELLGKESMVEIVL